MAKYLSPLSSHQMDLIFGALADPTRRSMLEGLYHQKMSVTEIARHYDFALPTISKHLSVLEKACLIHKSKIGRTYQIAAEPKTMRAIADYVSFYTNFWNKQIDNLEKFLERNHK